MFSQNNREPDNKNKNVFSHIYSGTQLAVTVLIFFFVGFWLDAKWSSSPWLSVVGAVVGFTLGIYNFIKEFYGEKKIN
ncbi:MAG: AtpZ/AtpI family protein [bacterium]